MQPELTAKYSNSLMLSEQFNCQLVLSPTDCYNKDIIQPGWHWSSTTRYICYAILLNNHLGINDKLDIIAIE